MRLVILMSIMILLSSFSSSADIKKIADEYQKGNLSKALSLADHKKYKDIHYFLKAQLYFSKNNDNSFESITSFLVAHPDWPQKASLIKIAESKITRNTSVHAILKWFRHNKPTTPNGHYYYYVAAKSSGYEKERLKPLLINAWVYGAIPDKVSGSFLKTYKDYLTEEDHASKISELLWAENVEDAKKYLNLVGKDYNEVFKAWIEILKKGKGADSYFRNIKGSYKYHSGLLYAYLKLYYKDTPSEYLTNLFIKSSKEPEHGKEWWKLKHYYARELMSLGKYNEAYKVASNHGLIEACDRADAEWLAGYLSFSYLKKPEEAVKHFENLYNISNFSISLARGAYWLGRSYANFKDKELAKKWFNIAASYGFTYYGMLAQLELGNKHLVLPENLHVEPKSSHKHHKNKYGQIAEFLSYTTDYETMKLFAKEAFNTATSNDEVASIYNNMKDNLGIYRRTEVAKIASQLGVFMINESYPTPYKLHGSVKNKPFAFAIMRQETVFDQYAKSTANALGLMQIQPKTAQGVAKKLGIKYDIKKLTSSSDYNIKLGTFYLELLMGETNGSYIRTSAHYNAGPVIDKWDCIKGDLSKLKLHDVIDRIELIPYYETRNYVQRIIENMQIYKYILNKDQKLNIKADLR